MADLDPISREERQSREQRVRQIARSFGFVGRVEYKHVLSRSGRAQYGLGTQSGRDLLTVYADAFVRDANPEDFSLTAIIAHERGHQIVCRDPRVKGSLPPGLNRSAEEALASLAASIIVRDAKDKQELAAKAYFEMLNSGIEPNEALDVLREIRAFMEHIL